MNADLKLAYPLIAVSCSIWLHQPAFAQPDMKKSQPDQLDFGMTYVGATMEGSFRLYQDGDDASRVHVEVKAPDFVKAEVIEKGSNTYGRLGSKVHVEVKVVIDTSSVGNFKGEILATVAGRELAVPVSARVLEPKKDATRLLVIGSPLHSTSTGDGSLFNAWRELVENAELETSCLLVEREKPLLGKLELSRFDVVLLGPGAVFWIKPPEIALLHDYLLQGGRVVVCANRFFSKTPERANAITSPYGLEMADTEDAGGGAVELAGGQITKHALTNGVERLSFFRASPITTKDPMNAKILVAAPNFEGQGLVAVARAGKGEVVLLGQSLWWNWISEKRAGKSQNSRLLQNLLTKKSKH